MHGSTRDSACCFDSLMSDVSRPVEAFGAGGAEIEYSFYVTPIKLRLCCGLWTARMMSFGWSVRRQQKQRDARTVRFDDGGEVMCSSGSRCAHQTNGTPRLSRETQSGKSGHALIDDDMGRAGVDGVYSEDEIRTSRTRRYDKVSNTSRNQT